MLVMIDNYDSFTYNLVQCIGELGVEVKVFRNDRITLEEIEDLNPTQIVISPGPCTPKDAGISIEVIKYFAGKMPVLGVCLGHQAVGEAFGGKVVRAQRLMHGKTSMIYHDEKTIFCRLPNPFEATRYHSLILERKSLPDFLEVTAWTDQDEVMGIRHRKFPIEGVQFHPESILTKSGKNIIENFILPGR